MRRGAGPHHASSPDTRQLVYGMALRRGCPPLWAGGAGEDGGRRYRPQRASRPLARPKGAPLIPKSPIRQPRVLAI